MPAIEPTEIIPPHQNAGRPGYGYVSQPSFSGVLSSRFMGLLLDFVIVGLLTGVVLVASAFLTLGLSLLFFPAFFPIIALLYNGITISGPGRGTWGMRMTGVEMRMRDGAPVPFVIAAVHAIFFYVSVSILTPLVLLIGFFRDDRRLLHDLLTGVVAVRRS